MLISKKRPLLFAALSALAFSAFSSAYAKQAEQKVVAAKITPENAASLIRSGPDAIGGIGDWLLSNGTLCAIISGVEHEGEFSSKGGSLVDLGFCGRADDHFSFTHELLQGSRKRPLDSDRIEIENNHDNAAVIVYGSADGANIITRYSISTEHDTQLHINKRLSRAEGESFNFFNTLNFNYHSLEPFVFNSKDLNLSNGYKAEDFVSRGISAMDVAARNADTVITTSPPTAKFGIAYGWQLASAERVEGSSRTPVPYFVLADDASNAMLVLTDTFYLGDGSKIGWLQLPQFPLLSLSDDALIETKEVIYVGQRGDVASVTDQLLQNSYIVSGRVSDANSAVHIDTENGVPVTHVRPTSDGTFTLKLPQGDYTLRATGTAKREAEIKFAVQQRDLLLDEVKLPQAATLELPQGHAMRLVFVGKNGTPNPDFGDRLTGFSVQEDDGEHFIHPVSSVFLAGVNGDRTHVDLAPGDYKVYATRGPEYSLEELSLSVEPESHTKLEIAIPQREVDTPNFIASDLHVHSGISFDNAFSETERVRTFVAEHGEVMVSSEHDVPVDFSPLISSMGVADKITSIAAAEVTSLLPSKKNRFTNGHANFFPYTPDPLAFRRGMVNHEDKRWRDVIHAIKQQQGDDVLMQLNHARINLALSGDLPNDWEELVDNGHFLDHMGAANHPYNPSKPLHSHPNNTLIDAHHQHGTRDLDFDLMEIINPSDEDNGERIAALRKDWLSFLKQGERIVATANSDSHRDSFQVAVPRTMVAVADDSIEQFQQSEFLRSLKNGNAYGTTGPMIELSLSGAKMGGTFKGQRGQLSVRVTSTEWIPVTNLKVQINGETVDEIELKDNTEHSVLLPLSFNKDSFVTIEVSGPISEAYADVYPGLEPYAYSNPIYVDYDADGEWQAPGL